MRKSLSILVVIFLWAACLPALAQQITVNAKLDSTVIKIGDQAHLSFEVSLQPNQKVVMPLFSDTIIGGLELVEQAKTDTVKSPDGQVLVKQTYTVTSFKDSLLYIPPFPFVSNGDTVWSKSLSLKVVQPFQIDTASNEIADIKGVYEPPFDWSKVLIFLLIIILLHGLFVGGMYIYRKYFKTKGDDNTEAQKVKLAPHLVALTLLENIKKEKPWQRGRFKEYHTELTDIIREYIERLYDLRSMEMTSEEILESLYSLRFEQKAAYLSLQQILRLADLVKFAKYNPGPDEHELSLLNAYLFVNQTKIEEVKPVEELTTEATEAEK